MKNIFDFPFFLVMFLVCAFYLHYHHIIMANLNAKFAQNRARIFIAVFSIALSLAIPMLGYQLYGVYLNLIQERHGSVGLPLSNESKIFYSVITYLLGVFAAAIFQYIKKMPRK